MKDLLLILTFFMCYSIIASEYDEAAILINRFHIKHPDISVIPVEGKQLNEFLKNLDQYSGYIEPEKYSRLQLYTKGFTRGLGGLVTYDSTNNRTLFIPFKNTSISTKYSQPALIIKSINGQQIEHLKPNEISPILNKLQEVRIVGSELISGKHFDRIIPLKEYKVPEVEDIIVGEQHILRIHVFRASSTATKIKQWIQSIDSKSPVIIDLRYTTGGSLFESIDSASIFAFHTGLAASTVESDDIKYNFNMLPQPGQPGQPVHTNTPIYLLTGHQTTSAGEVFARALSHHNLAVTIGQQTYGKCVIQRTYPLESGGGLTLTVGKLLDSDGNYCDGEGLVPDINVEGDLVYNDSILVRAIEKYRSTHFLTCLSEKFLSIDKAILIGENIGWNNGVGQLRTIVHKSANTNDELFQYCLAPALKKELTLAVVSRQKAITNQSLQVVKLSDFNQDDKDYVFGVRLGSYNKNEFMFQHLVINEKVKKISEQLEIIWYPFYAPEQAVLYRAYAMPFKTKTSALDFCTKIVDELSDVNNCQGNTICRIGILPNPC